MTLIWKLLKKENAQLQSPVRNEKKKNNLSLPK